MTSKVWSDLQTARDTLAQIGIQLEVAAGYPKVIPLPTGIDDSVIDAFQFADVDRKILKEVFIPSQKGKQLIAACGTPASDFTIIYCNKILNEAHEADYAGYAYPRSGNGSEKKIPPPSFANHAFVAGFTKGPWFNGRFTDVQSQSTLVFPHELCHLLTDASHFGTAYSINPQPPSRVIINLMRSGAPSYSPGIGSGCRLEDDQQGMIDKLLKAMKKDETQ